MQMLRVAAMLVVAAVTAGCLSIDSNIKVKPDGTGTIEQSMLVNASAVGMMSMMGGNESGGGAEGPTPEDMFSDDKLRAEAARLGEGVTYVSSTPITDGEMKGVKALYAFTDFNKLELTASPPAVGGEGESMKAAGTGSTIDMVLSRAGGSSLITLDMFGGTSAAPDTSDASPGDNPFGNMPKEMMGMLAPMFKDMRVAVSVEPVGQLVRTNATLVDGQKITVLDIAFGELFANPASVEKMEKLGSQPSLDQIRTALAGVKGIKINQVDKLEIEFR